MPDEQRTVSEGGPDRGTRDQGQQKKDVYDEIKNDTGKMQRDDGSSAFLPIWYRFCRLQKLAIMENDAPFFHPYSSNCQCVLVSDHPTSCVCVCTFFLFFSFQKQDQVVEG